MRRSSIINMSDDCLTNLRHIQAMIRIESNKLKRVNVLPKKEKLKYIQKVLEN